MVLALRFPISRDPPEGGTRGCVAAEPQAAAIRVFPISRDPPEGGTIPKGEGVSIYQIRFPISRDPPEGGTNVVVRMLWPNRSSFQFLGIPPKGELAKVFGGLVKTLRFQFLGIPPKGELLIFLTGFGTGDNSFPISRDPPEGGTFTGLTQQQLEWLLSFPISRDPPEGGTSERRVPLAYRLQFPISRDPPEGGTLCAMPLRGSRLSCFQFLGIPPKGELYITFYGPWVEYEVSNF